uniref:Uncharacterized protein n=1 Tax=Lactuca sativa TaxID=4236 RepID=A0A9R1XG32_LACSA|nr:hypothetical protein LSAT_V11C400208210 [Lactuca sativa]
MDALALKEKKCKVLETKLHYTQQKVDDLLEEKEVTRSCIYDINRLVSDIIETRDPMISITVEKHLLEKLRPVFAIFSPFGGCFHADVVFETKGEGRSKVYTEDVKPKVSVKPPIIKQDPKDKDSLFSNEPIIDDSEDNEPDEDELKRRKACKAEIDEHARIFKEAEEKEELKRKLRPLLKNSQDSQFDLPITLKASRFRAFIKVASNFYLKHMKPQFETWSASKIVAVKVTGPIGTESFPNAKFKVARGSARQTCEFTLADFRCLNPNDWMVIYNILLQEKGEVRTDVCPSSEYDQVLHSGSWVDGRGNCCGSYTKTKCCSKRGSKRLPKSETRKD